MGGGLSPKDVLKPQTKELTRDSLFLKQDETLFVKLGTVFSPVVISGSRDAVKMGILSTQAPALRSVQKLETKQRQQLFYDIPKPLRFTPTPRITTPRTPFRIFPPLGFLPGFSLPKSFRTERRGKRKLFYQPSLAAIALGITSPKIPSLYWTGIQTRPRIVKKKRKGGKKK